MNRQHHFQVLIFSFAMLIVLLRPYAVYRIDRQPRIANDPVKVNALLQRLIKKKDEHHALSDNDLIAVQQPRTVRVLPALRLIAIVQFFAGFSTAIRQVIDTSVSIFRSSSNKHYLLFARLQI